MNRKNENEVRITTYDKLMRAWQNSMEMAKEFKIHAHEMQEDQKASQVFAAFAEDEGLHAAKLRDLLLEYQNQGK